MKSNIGLDISPEKVTLRACTHSQAITWASNVEAPRWGETMMLGCVLSSKEESTGGSSSNYALSKAKVTPMEKCGASA